MPRLLALLRVAPLIILTAQLASCTKDAPVTPPVVEPIDTTSHDFRWEVTFLENSQLTDVFAINDSDVWAVGKIILSDSIGKPDDANPCGAAHWDGKKWTVIAVPSVNSSGQFVKRRMEGVFAFGSNDVWMTSYAGSYAHWDGKEWNSAYIPEGSGSLERIFGFSSKDIYFAGAADIIVHWDGHRFTRMESGFKYPYEIIDMWGVEKDGVKELWAVARVHDQTRSAILVYTPLTGKWETVWSSELGIGTNQPYVGTVYALYPYALGSYFVGCSSWTTKGVYEMREANGQVARTSQTNLYPQYTFMMNGSGRNNVFIVGDQLLVAHFNGNTWTVYRELQTNFLSSLRGLSVLQNSVFAVGYDATRGIIVHGVRVR